MRPVAPRVPPPATTMVLNPGGIARLSPVWRAASAPRGLCCTVCRVRTGRGEERWGGGSHSEPYLPPPPGGACLEPTSCPCEWGGSFFPPGTVLQKDCGNW